MKPLVLLTLLLSLCLVGCGESPKTPLLTKKIVFIGDSITVKMGSNPEFTSHSNWINKGINGQGSPEIAARFMTDVIAIHPDIVHIVAGTNDVYPGWPSATTYANISSMVETAKINGIEVILGTIPPWGTAGIADPTSAMCAHVFSLVPSPDYTFACADNSPARYERIDDLNSWIEQLASIEHGVTIVDYHSVLTLKGMYYSPDFTDDGVHPNSAGQAAMMRALLAIPD